VVGYAGLRFGSTVAAQLRGLAFKQVSMYTTRQFSVNTFAHLHNLSMSFHLKRKTGLILRVMDRGVSSLGTLMQLVFFTILPTVFEVSAVSVIFYHLNSGASAALTVACAVAYVAFTVVVVQYRTKIRQRVIDTDNAVSEKSVDSLLNFETVKLFNAEEFEVARFDHLLQEYQNASVFTQWTLSFLNTGQDFFINGCVASVLTLAILSSRSGTTTVGEFVLINTYLIQLFQPLSWLGSAYRTITQSFQDLEKMLDLRDTVPSVQDNPEALPLRFPPGSSASALAFRNVSFSYEGDAPGARPVLRDVSFEVPAGRTLAIVGPTGSGKSTIVRLILRLYDVDKGRVEVDGQDVAKGTLRSLRRAVGVVAQDTVLFNDTIGYNIKYSRAGETVPDELVVRAAEIAQIAPMIDTFEKKYDTMVGERGLRLSGGEKQRVGLARMVLQSPRIIVLDEATSALDTRTERAVQAALKAACEGRTAVVVAHRLSTVVDADEIVVLKEGEVVERGAHAELMGKEGGEYRAMWDAQLREV